MHGSRSLPFLVVSAVAAAVAAQACAMARPERPGPETVSAAPAAARPSYDDAALGYRFSVPDSGFRTSGDAGWVVASGDLGVRVFPVFLPQQADATSCLQHVVETDLLPVDLAHPVSSAAELSNAAVEGLAHGERRLYLRAFPREDTCLVAVVDGREGARTATAAAVVLGTFVVGQPDVHVRPLLKGQAGWALLRARRGAEALERFEAALAISPELTRERLGAGFAAAMLGRDGAAKAVEHLERA
ncbi:MAG: hypothetical protein RL199_1385, partial [Pseudomonadota bacterium]